MCRTLKATAVSDDANNTVIKVLRHKETKLLAQVQIKDDGLG